jgi:hypothetical protein
MGQLDDVGWPITIDAFATESTALAPPYFTRYTEPRAEAEDAFTVSPCRTGPALCAHTAPIRTARPSSPTPLPPSSTPSLSAFVVKARADGASAIVVAPLSVVSLVEQTPSCFCHTQRQGLPPCPPPTLSSRRGRSRRTRHLRRRLRGKWHPLPHLLRDPLVRPGHLLPWPGPRWFHPRPGGAGAHPCGVGGRWPCPSAMTPPLPLPSIYTVFLHHPAPGSRPPMVGFLSRTDSRGLGPRRSRHTGPTTRPQTLTTSTRPLGGPARRWPRPPPHTRHVAVTPRCTARPVPQ